MLNRDELVGLYRDLRNVDVLSVYVDGAQTDPANRRRWSTVLQHGLDHERRRIEELAPEELKAFDAARERVQAQLTDHKAFLPHRGWVAFATPDGVRYGEGVAVPMPDLVRWEAGIRVAPYVRALKQDRIVVAAVADSRKARVFTYRDGAATELEGLLADRDFGDLAEASSSKRASAQSGSRGETATDAAHRLLETSAARLQAELIDEVAKLAGPDGLVVFGGTPEVVAALGRGADPFGDRWIARSGMHVGMSEAEVRDEIEAAASELSRRLQERLLDQVVDAARSGGKGSLGVEDTRRALLEGRVDCLLLTRGFREREADLADHFVGTAFEQGAAVEELSAEAAQRLDGEAEGVGARLRYTT